MREFDNEPGAGGGYTRAFAKPMREVDGVIRRIVIRLRGRPVSRVSITVEERRDGVEGALVRCDDAHGFFHRHVAGWPQPGDAHAERLGHVRPKMRAPFAAEEIEGRFLEWEAEVFGERGEVSS